MKLSKIKYSIPALLLLSATYVNATTVKEVVQHTMAKNPEVMSLLKNNEAFRYYIDEEKGGYYPKIDLTAYIGAKRTKDDPNGGTKSTTNQDGYNAQLDLEQMLYDGGFTPARIDEAKRKASSNELNNRNRVENIMFESITAYLGMVKADEMTLLTKENIQIHDEYMLRAKQTEEISGESLNRIQVSAKLHFAKNQLLEEIKNKKASVSNFEKSVGMESEGFICRPNLNDTLISVEKQDVIELALKHNYQILEQVENIKEQRAVIRQSKADFLPSLTFKAQAILDDDLLNNDADTNVYSGRIELKYNLFNGSKDSSVKQREVLFLQESQQALDTVTKDVVDRLTVAFDNYQISKEQINELKLYIADNEEVLAIYQDQFDGGTRNFLDVLNAEGDIYNAKTTLVDAEYIFFEAYYEVFSLLSTLNTAVLSSEDQVCKQMQIITKKKVKEDPSLDELSDLLEETPEEVKAPEVEEKMPEPVVEEAKDPVVEEKMPEPIVEKVVVQQEEIKMEPSKEMMATNMELSSAIISEFSKELEDDILSFDKNNLSLKLSDSHLELNKAGVIMSADYKELLRDIFPRLVRLTKEYKSSISQVRVEGHSSSRFDGVQSISKKLEMNKIISLQRAKTVLGYAYSLETDMIVDNRDFIKNTYKAFGMSSEKIIKNSDGSENALLSKRVEFVIIPK